MSRAFSYLSPWPRRLHHGHELALQCTYPRHGASADELLHAEDQVMRYSRYVPYRMFVTYRMVPRFVQILCYAEGLFLGAHSSLSEGASRGDVSDPTPRVQEIRQCLLSN